MSAVLTSAAAGSIAVGTPPGVLVLRESDASRRLGAAAALVTGVVVLTLG